MPCARQERGTASMTSGNGDAGDAAELIRREAITATPFCRICLLSPTKDVTMKTIENPRRRFLKLDGCKLMPGAPEISPNGYCVAWT
jgi:hypothetical protein